VIDVLCGGSVIASFIAGMVALFAPCCISVMLPAYFASSFERRRALVAMTFVFAAGVALVILPIPLGAAAIGAAIKEHHLPIYLGGGALMLALGVFMIAGGKLRFPMPGLRARERHGRWPPSPRLSSASTPSPSSRAAAVRAAAAAAATPPTEARASTRTRSEALAQVSRPRRSSSRQRPDSPSTSPPPRARNPSSSTSRKG
jgi:cytochrome c biogenesis protein CcdA